MADHSMSSNGYELTESFEGLRLAAYRDSAGIWTIGYGHTGRGVYQGLVITQQQAESLLKLDIAAAAAAVNHFVTSAINQNQFDALTDFTFNLGAGSLANSSLLRYINAGDFALAVEEFPKWDHVGGVVNEGLLRRRKAEAALFDS